MSTAKPTIVTVYRCYDQEEGEDENGGYYTYQSQRGYAVVPDTDLEDFLLGENEEGTTPVRVFRAYEKDLSKIVEGLQYAYKYYRDRRAHINQFVRMTYDTTVKFEGECLEHYDIAPYEIPEIMAAVHNYMRLRKEAAQ